jgi:hypothetical protein
VLDNKQLKINSKIDHILIDRRWHSSVLDIIAGDCDACHCLMVAEVPISRNKMRKWVKQYWVEISDGVTALENLDDEMDISKAWETIRENIKIPAEESLGYYEFKQNKPWFNERCSELLDQRKQSKLQW